MLGFGALLVWVFVILLEFFFQMKVIKSSWELLLSSIQKLNQTVMGEERVLEQHF